MIYTGEPDRYFDFKLGKLNWRSLNFKFDICAIIYVVT